MNNNYQKIIEDLKKQSDIKYKEFTKKLSPSESSDYMIGVRIPILRNYAKAIAKGNAELFINSYEGLYFEEKMLQGMVIGYSNDIKIYDEYLYSFSKIISDWSVCDCCASSLKLIKINQEHFLPLINRLLNSNMVYQVRFGVVLLMDYYLCDNYIDLVSKSSIEAQSDEYYVNMAIAWCLCECFIKYPLKIDKYLNKDYLNKFVLNKTISKICDSYRVDDKTKNRLKKRRIIN